MMCTEEKKLKEDTAFFGEDCNNENMEKKAEQEFKKNYAEAEELLKDTDKVEKFIQRLEKKLQSVPKIGKYLSHIPAFASLVKSYIKKEYTEVPTGTIVAILAALIYFVNPFDLIPDVIPGFGQLDDVAIIMICLKLVDNDVKEYLKWREANGKTVTFEFIEDEVICEEDEVGCDISQ